MVNYVFSELVGGILMFASFFIIFGSVYFVENVEYSLIQGFSFCNDAVKFIYIKILEILGKFNRNG